VGEEMSKSDEQLVEKFDEAINVTLTRTSSI
jgi:hypothetical protein